jgi:hypothetical protein
MTIGYALMIGIDPKPLQEGKLPVVISLENMLVKLILEDRSSKLLKIQVCIYWVVIHT